MARFPRFLALLLIVLPATVAAVSGGWGNKHMAAPGDRITELISNARADAETVAGTAFATWEPISYSVQVVAGTNIEAVVRTSPTEVHTVRIFEPLPFRHQPPEVSSVMPGEPAVRR